MTRKVLQFEGKKSGHVPASMPVEFIEGHGVKIGPHLFEIVKIKRDCMTLKPTTLHAYVQPKEDPPPA